MGINDNPKPLFVTAAEAHTHPNTESDGVLVKMAEVDVKMSGVAVDRTIAGLSESQIGVESKKNGGEVSLLEAVGHLYAMDGRSKQMSFVSD